MQGRDIYPAQSVKNCLPVWYDTLYSRQACTCVHVQWVPLNVLPLVSTMYYQGDLFIHVCNGGLSFQFWMTVCIVHVHVHVHYLYDIVHLEGP